MADEKLKVGIIGLGAIGSIHADCYNAAGNVEIAAVCDIKEAVLARQGDRLGVKDRFTAYAELLKTDVEAVSVCVPNYLHKEIAVAVLEAGKHLLLEKPMALDAAEGAAIVAAHEKAGTVAAMGMCNRQRPPAQKIKALVEHGLLGEIYHARAVMIRRRGIPGLGGWFTTKAQSGGGPMIDLGVHWFDLVMWMTDQWQPTSVSAATYAKFGSPMKDYTYTGMWAGPPKYDGVFDVEDYSSGFVRFGGKMTLSFEIVWAANAPGGSFIELLGDKGGVRFEGEKVTLYTEHDGHLADIVPQLAAANQYEVQAVKFVGACRGENDPPATLPQGCTVMKLLDAIYASSEAGAEVPIAEPPALPGGRTGATAARRPCGRAMAPGRARGHIPGCSTHIPSAGCRGCCRLPPRGAR